MVKLAGILSPDKISGAVQYHVEAVLKVHIPLSIVDLCFTMDLMSSEIWNGSYSMKFTM